MVGWLVLVHFFQRTALRILQIFGQKLDIDIVRKLTEPEKIFEKILNDPKFEENVFFGGFSTIFQKLCDRFCSNCQKWWIES